MSDKYIEETRPLFKHLQTEAFRFIIIQSLHRTPLKRLADDLRQRFPDRPLQRVDASQATFSHISATYYQMERGFFWLDNFDRILDEEIGPARPEPDPAETKRRHDVSAGLNLRRDTFAKTPIALFVCVRTDAHLRQIMLKMPDLWSFRSLVVDYRANPQPDLMVSPPRELSPDRFAPPVVQRDPQTAAELKRLQKQLAQTPDEEVAYKRALYPQIVDAQVQLGQYTHALACLDEWELIDPDNGSVFLHKGDVLEIIGDIAGAKTAFEQAKLLYTKRDELANAAVCDQRLGDIEVVLGDLEQAMTHYLEYNQTFKELNDEYPDQDNYKTNLAVSYEKLGETHTSLGDLSAALRFFEDEVKLFEELYAAYPTNVSFKNGLAISYEKLGNTHTSLGDLEAARRFYEDYNKLMEELYAAYPTNVEFKNNLAISYEKLGSVHTALGDLEAARRFYEKDAKLSEELYAAYPTNVSFKNGLAISYERLGSTHTSLGDLSAALRFFEDEVKLFEELYAAYPTSVEFKNGLAISYSKLGSTHTALGDLSAALRFYEDYNKVMEELYAAYPTNVSFKNGLAISYIKLGLTYEKKENPKDARNWYQLAEKLWAELVESAPQYVEFQNNLQWVENQLKSL